MSTFILKRKTFSSGFPKIKDWAKANGYTPGKDGRFSPGDWTKIQTEYNAAKTAASSSGAGGGTGSGGGGGKPDPKAIEAAKKEAERKEMERLAKEAEENSFLTKGKKFLKENKTPILIGGGIILASGAGYGLYKHSQANEQKRREAEKNDKVRNRIVGNR